MTEGAAALSIPPQIPEDDFARVLVAGRISLGQLRAHAL